MQTTQLGQLQASVLPLGCMYFGTTTSEAMARRLLDAYVDRGGNFLDTSNNYAFWPPGGTGAESELLLGRWLKERGRRHDVLIATKVGAEPQQPGAGLERVKGLAASVIQDSLERSLRRLGCDHVDMLYAHVDHRAVPLEETLGAFDTLVKAGKVRQIACSNYTAWRIERARQVSRAHGFAEYVAVQHRHSYLQPHWRADFGIQSRLGIEAFGPEHSVNADLLDYALNNPEFRIVAYSPLLQGAYTDPRKLRDQYHTPENEQRRHVLDSIASEVGCTVNQLVLAWMLQARPHILPIVAASRLDQLEENLAALERPLDTQQLTRLEAAA